MTYVATVHPEAALFKMKMAKTVLMSKSACASPTADIPFLVGTALPAIVALFTLTPATRAEPVPTPAPNLIILTSRYPACFSKDGPNNFQALSSLALSFHGSILKCICRMLGKRHGSQNPYDIKVEGLAICLHVAWLSPTFLFGET